MGKKAKKNKQKLKTEARAEEVSSNTQATVDSTTTPSNPIADPNNNATNNNSHPINTNDLNNLYWEILDASNAAFKYDNYETLAETYRKENYGYSKLLFDKDFLSQFKTCIQRAKDCPLNSKIEELEKTGEFLDNATKILAKQPNKISINKHVFHFLLDCFISHLNIVDVLLPAYQGFYDAETKVTLNSKEKEDDNKNPQPTANYDFAILQCHFKKLLEFYLVLKSKLTNDLTAYITGPEHIAEFLIHAGIYRYSLEVSRNNGHVRISVRDEILEHLSSYKALIPEYMYAWASTICYGDAKSNSLPIAKHYFHKYCQKFEPIAKLYEQKISLFGAASQLATKVYHAAGINKETNRAKQIYYLKEAQFYYEAAIRFGLQCAKLNKNHFQSTYKTHLSRKITNLKEIHNKILALKKEELGDLKLPVIISSHEKDDNILVLTLDDKLNETDFLSILQKALFQQGVNAYRDETKPNQLFVRDFIYVPITTLVDTLHYWQTFLPKVEVPQQKTTPQFSEDNIFHFPMDTTTTTLTQMKKSKGKSEEPKPSIQEQIKLDMQNRKIKQPKKITFPGVNGQPTYTYDANNPDCEVIRLEGEVKRLYMCVDKSLLAYLAENNPLLLSAFLNLWENKTVRPNAHTTFIINGSQFNEITKGEGLKFFDDRKVSNDINNNAITDSPQNEKNASNNVAEEKYDTKSVTTKTELFGKARMANVEGRLFGRTVATISKISSNNKPPKHYHLIKLDTVKEFKEAKKNN